MGNNISKYWVYKLTSPSGNVYIGITSNIDNRFRAYKNARTCSQPILHATILKYGWDNLKKEILHCFLLENEAKQLEIKYISFFKQEKISLNSSDGGDTGSGLSGAEHHLSVRVCQFDLLGNHIKTFDTISQASESIDNRFLSTISRACREKTYLSHGYLWCYEYDYLKFGRPIYSQPNWDRFKVPVVQLDCNLSFIAEYPSIKDAAAAIGGNPGPISNCLCYHGKSYKKFLWIHKDDYDNGILPDNSKVINTNKSSSKPIIQYSKDGNFLAEYESISLAAKLNNTDPGTIIDALKGRRISKKFIWKYKQS